MAVAVVERFKQEFKYMDCPAGQKIVAVVERWLLVEVQLSAFSLFFTPYQPNNRVNNTQGFE